MQSGLSPSCLYLLQPVLGNSNKEGGNKNVTARISLQHLQNRPGLGFALIYLSLDGPLSSPCTQVKRNRSNLNNAAIVFGQGGAHIEECICLAFSRVVRWVYSCITIGVKAQALTFTIITMLSH